MYDIYEFHSLEVFHTSISCWAFTRVGVTASLYRSLGFFNILVNLSNIVIWMVSSLQVFNSPIPSSGSGRPFQAHQLHIIYNFTRRAVNPLNSVVTQFLMILMALFNEWRILMEVQCGMFVIGDKNKHSKSNSNPKPGLKLMPLWKAWRILIIPRKLGLNSKAGRTPDLQISKQVKEKNLTFNQGA